MKTILILMDTLNRHMLKTYCPDAEAVTPNIDRLARRCMIFDNLCDNFGSNPKIPYGIVRMSTKTGYSYRIMTRQIKEGTV